MKSALNAWSCPGHHDFETMFRALKAAGFDGVELNVDDENNPSCHSLTVNTTNEELKKIRDLSEKYELPVASISSSLYHGPTLGAGTQAGRDRSRQIMEAQIRCAEALGGTGILVVPGGIGPDCSIAKAWDNNMESLRSLSDIIEGTSVKVGLENVWNNFFIDPFQMARFIDELGVKNVGAYFDVGNVAIFTWPEYWIDILGSRIVKIHVKDFSRCSGNSGNFVNLLEGAIRWNKVMEALRGAGYDDYLVAELGCMNATPDYLYRITKDALDEIRAM